MSHRSSIVLVHGALTDGSVWREVTARLQADGLTVHVPAMGLRGLATDVAHLDAFLETISGPVVLAGHSYGGTIISHPDIAQREVTALVYVSAFAPDAGESTGELNGRWPGSRLGEATTIVRPCPDGGDLYLRPESFADVYAGDLPPATVAVLAASQRPIEVGALGESFAGEPSWRSIPSWTLISTDDHSLPAAGQRAMAQRAGATAVEVAACHAAPLSQPQAVAELILAAGRVAVPAGA